MITTLDDVQSIFIGLISLYIIVWSLPVAILLTTVSLANFKHIITIDKYLAKDLDKYYDINGYMRPDYKLSFYRLLHQVSFHTLSNEKSIH